VTFFKDLGYKDLYWIDLIFKWYTRPRSKLFTIGKFLIVTGLATIGVTTAFKLALKTPEGYEVTASLSEKDTGIFIFITAAIFIIFGFGFILYDALRHIRESGKANDILVEHIALFKPLSTSFLSTVTKSKGKVRNVKIDLSEHYNEGILNNPVEAVNDTRVMLRKALTSLSDATGNENATIHYGGTPPVCLGFYSGFIVGNTTSVTLWDYDRDLGVWHSLDRSFDNNHPKIDTSEYSHINSVVCLILSITFDIENTVRNVVPTDSIVTIIMPKINHDNMSSLSKISKFKVEFRELLNKFNSDGIKDIHIFCAAQSSFNFALGQQITKNHPKFYVHEFVNNPDKAYPWALKFNEKNDDLPMIIKQLT